MDGKLYGIGVGPGDPEYLTIKALRLIKECDVIAVPGRSPQDTVAYKIVDGIYPEIEKKELLGIHMPMTKDKAVLKTSHEKGADRLCEELDRGKNVAFLTLGDPTLYSTYIYLHEEVKRKGYPVEIVSGIPSFCAAAAKLNMSIVMGAQQLHIIPAAYQVKEGLELSGTKVLMKAGRRLSEVKEQMETEQKLSDVKGLPKDCTEQVFMVENCGMEEERICRGAEQMPETAGYYTLVIVKEEEWL